MGNDRDITIRISADGTAAIAGIRQVGDATGNLGTRTVSVTESLKQNWFALTAGVTAAYLAMQKVWDLAEKAAAYAESLETLNALSSQYNVTGQQMVETISRNSNGLIGLATSAKVSADALAKGFTPTQLAEMAKWAPTIDDFSASVGSSREAFETLVSSMAAGRERGLVQLLGATIDLEAAFGKQAATMSKAEKAAALYNLVAQRMVVIQKTGVGSTDSLADKMERFKNQIEGLRLVLGDFILRAGAGLLATFQSVAAFAMGLSIVIMAPIRALMLATDYLGITKGKADEYGASMEAMGEAAQHTAEQAASNFELMRKGMQSGTVLAAKGGHLGLDGDPGANLKRQEQLTEIMQKFSEERALIDASEKDKDLVRLGFWFEEQKKKLHELGAGHAEFSALAGLYAEKRHDAIAAWATKTSEFYLEVQRTEAKENDQIEKDRNAALFLEREQGVKERLAIADTYAKAGDTETESDAIRRRAEGEREILGIRQEGLVASITEQTTWQETLKIMWQVRDVENQIESSKRLQVVDLDARRLAIEREILDLKRQQRELVAEMQIRYAQDALNKIGAGGAADLVGMSKGIDAGIDPYTKDYDLWSAKQDQKIQHLIELGNTEAQLKDEYRQYDLMQEQMVQQQKLAMASAGFSMMAGMAQSFYAMSGNQNKAAFAAYKAFSIAQTAIDTYRAAQGAYAALAGIPIVGPALGIAAAAAAIFAGMARVQAISAMQPGGGVSVSAGGGGGLLVLPAAATAPAPAPQETIISPTVNIHIYGNVVDHDKFARELVPAITKAIGDGVQ